MNLFSRHLTGLIDFRGRENRQPFWLWILIIYAFQMIVGMILMIPIMINLFQRIMPMAQRDPHAFDNNPQVMMQSMAPMMQQIMSMSAVMALVLIALVAAAVVRRLHDSDRSGWWSVPVFAIQIVSPLVMAAVFPRYFAAMGAMGSFGPGRPPNFADPAFQSAMRTMNLVSLVNLLGFVLLVTLIVFLALPGTVGPNRFGDDPLRMP
jgi:uncharacterized membrane protein YhaH (DUF805 family)